MTVHEHVSLSQYSTFRTGGTARFLIEVRNVGEIKEALAFAHKQHLPIYILGGGSNLLISQKPLQAVVIRPMIRGLEMRSATDEASLSLTHPVFEVSAGAGEVWDDFVSYTVSQGLYGLENLSYIPGTVGAAPVQNIGAYGIEVGEMISFVEYVDIETGMIHRLNALEGECKFSYRNSIFKNELKGKAIIIRVGFRLLKGGRVHLGYKDVQAYFHDRYEKDVTAAEVRNAIIAIRKAKLPDINQVGTAGSFFKNPVITRAQYERLLERYPGLPAFTEHISPDSDAHKELVKVSLGWVLDKICNMKGYKDELQTLGTWPQQALVLVNYGGATGEDIRGLANEITLRVKEAMGIDISWEVEWWPY